MGHDEAIAEIQRLAKYADRYSLPYYRQWVLDGPFKADGSVIAAAAITLADDLDDGIARSALHAWASFGSLDNNEKFENSRFAKSHPDEVSFAVRYLRVNAITPEELLGNVHDEPSFIDFVQALAKERFKAQETEHDNPRTYTLDGAFGWKNADIGSFLEAACAGSSRNPVPTWRHFAEFLYGGKVYE